MRFAGIIVFVMMLLGYSGAQAQQCDIIPFTITDLSDPQFVAPSYWSFDYGDLNMQDRFEAGFAESKSGHTILAGIRELHGGAQKALVTVKLDLRGRAIWEKIFWLPRLQDVVDIVETDKGFLLVANISGQSPHGSHIWLGFFDHGGVLLTTRRLSESGLALEATDILETGNGYVLSVYATPKEGLSHSGILKLDKSGRKLEKRFFDIGLDNLIRSVAAMPDGGFIAGGTLRRDNGLQTGWIVRLNQSGGLIWQRQYPRGNSGIFEKALHYRGDYAILAGSSRPATGGNAKHPGSWLMMVDIVTGEPLWERFNTEDHSALKAEDLLVHEDGQISVLMNADWKGQEPGLGALAPDMQKSFIRLVTINGRGVYLESNAYFQGEAASANMLFTGSKGERIMAGSMLKDFTVTMESGPDKGLDKTFQSLEGLSLAADRIRPYNDPCFN